MSCNKKCFGKYANIDFDTGIPNRFDLEDDIARQSDIVDNINLLIESILDGNTVDVDKVCSTLSGIVELHQLRHERLWTTFVHLFRLDNVNLDSYDDNSDQDVDF